MARVYERVYLGDGIRPLGEASLNVASAAVLYGLSVYTVFPVHTNNDGKLVAFRLKEHFERLINSARIIGLDTFEKSWDYERFLAAVKEVIAINEVQDKAFVRVTVHAAELVPGTR